MSTAAGCHSFQRILYIVAIIVLSSIYIPFTFAFMHQSNRALNFPTRCFRPHSLLDRTRLFSSSEEEPSFVLHKVIPLKQLKVCTNMYFNGNLVIHHLKPLHCRCRVRIVRLGCMIGQSESMRGNLI